MDKYTQLKPGDLFVVHKENFIKFFRFSEDEMVNNLLIYIENLSGPFFSWFGSIFGNIPRLLLSTVTNVPFDFIKKFFQERLYNSLPDDYVFAFPYVGNGWVMVSEKRGVYLYKVNFNMLKNVDVFRVKEEFDPIEYQKTILSFWNLPTNYSQTNILKDILIPFLSILNIQIQDDPLFTKMYEQLEIPFPEEIKTLSDVELIIETFRRIDINLIDGDKKSVSEILKKCEKLF